MTTAARSSTPTRPSDNTAVRYRYPGAPPFEDTDLARRLFRGRAEEADAVLHSILSTDLFLLYAESGLGKTSLLNAGVLQELRDRGHWPVSVRLNDTARSPAALVHSAIREAARSDASVELIDELPHAADDTSLWDVLGALEVWRGNDLQTPVVIFDQFEEIFTLQWDDTVRHRFIEEFGEVVRGHREQLPNQPDTVVPPPRVKFVLVIREDSLGELEALSTDVPQIMRNRFRLGGLALESADSAIREPGLLHDDRLGSQRFEYTEEAAAEILAFLRSSSRSAAGLAATVDPSQLQILCQYVERAIVPRKGVADASDEIVRIDAHDLGGRSGLDHILSAFYRRNLEPFGASQRRQVRRLCEKGLISPQSRRLSLEESQIRREFGVDVPTLQRLVDGRLLRAQPRLDSVSYELAHDTLIPAIATERQRRRGRIWSAAAAVVGCVLFLMAGLAIVMAAGGADDDSVQQVRLGDEPPFLIEPAATSTPRALLVPNVVGLNVDDAIEALAQLGLTANILEVNSDGAEGDVLSQSPSPVETADEETMVVLQVSVGRGVVLRDDFVVTTPGSSVTVDVRQNDDDNNASTAMAALVVEADAGVVVEILESGEFVVSAAMAGTYEVSYGVGEVAPDQRGTLTVSVEEFEAVIVTPPGLAEVGSAIQFVGDSRGSIASRAWDFGDEMTATGQRVEHTYETAGTYRVTLTITDQSGNTTSKSTDVDVVDPTGTVAFEWPYGDFFDVPQRGREPVRGTGCGGDNSIGDQIPDGTWYGNVSSIDRASGTLMLDLICVFYDDAGAEIVAAGVGSGPPDFYVVNNLERFRTVELHQNFEHHDAVRTEDGCVDPEPPPDSASDHFTTAASWIVIAEGQAVFALTSCMQA